MGQGVARLKTGDEMEQASAWAWKTTTESSGQRLVLLALADTANHLGECWDAVEHLADKTRIDERQVRKHLDALEGLGLLTRERCRRSDGSLGTYWYQLALTAGTPVPVDHRTSTTALPELHDRPTGHPRQ